MRKILFLIFLFPLLVNAQQRVLTFGNNNSGTGSGSVKTDNFDTYTAMVANAPSNNKIGDLITTAGFYTEGDGGGATYYFAGPSYSGYVDSIHTTPVSGGFLVFQGNEISTKQYGIVHDVVDQQTYSLSGTTVTCSGCSFTTADNNKVIYLEKSFSIADKLEADADYQGVVANYAAIPAGSDGDIYKVTDPSDYSAEDTLSSVHYFARRTSSTGFRPYLHNTDSWYTISANISGTQVTIDDTPNPTNLTGLEGRYGTNNIYRHNKLIQLTNNIKIKVIVNGDYLVASSLDDINTYNYDDSDANFDSVHEILWEGVGNPTIHTVHIGDTLGALYDQNIEFAINNFVNGFWNYGTVSTGDFVHYEFRNFTVKGQSFSGPRTMDGQTKGTFTFSTGDKSVTFNNVDAYGNDGFFYNSGVTKLRMYDCRIDGLYSGENMIQPFGSCEPIIVNCEFHDNGVRNFYSPDGKSRGRIIYVNNNKPYDVRGNLFKNNEGHSVQFFTSGADVIDTINITQRSIGNTFAYDNGSLNGIGYYTSRTHNDFKSIGDNFVGTNGSKLNAINFAGGATVANGTFRNATITNSYGVGTNNVYQDIEEGQIYVTDCKFYDSTVSIQSLSNGLRKYFYFNNCYFYQTDRQGWLYRVAGNSNSDEYMEVEFNDCVFEGQYEMNNVGFRFESRLVFAESFNRVNTEFNRCTFGLNQNPNTGLLILASTVRDSMTLTFNDCVNLLDTTYIEIADAEAVLKGSGNTFKELQIENTGGDTDHEFGFGTGVAPDTLTAAATTTTAIYDYDEYTVSGTATITQLIIPDGDLEQVTNATVTVHFIDAATLDTGGNINASSLAISAGDRVKFRNDPSTQQLQVLEINSP